MRLFKRLSRLSAPIQVRVSGQVGKSQYVVFRDGFVVIETPKGLYRFHTPEELVSQVNASHRGQ